MTCIAYVLPLHGDGDVAVARRRVRELAEGSALTTQAVEDFATAVSALARNVIAHTRRGEILLGTALEDDRVGLIAIAKDDGANTQLERSPRGAAPKVSPELESARALADEVDVQSTPFEGTTVTLVKWAKAGRASTPLAK
ncbi:MAG: ATP-binding protein [Myxococcota bacterium]